MKKDERTISLCPCDRGRVLADMSLAARGAPRFAYGRLAFAVFLLFCFLRGPSALFAQTDYVLGPEDEISITVWDHPDLSRKERINLEGKISFPLIGDCRLRA